jgi:hypothetical protein
MRRFIENNNMSIALLGIYYYLVVVTSIVML